MRKGSRKPDKAKAPGKTDPMDISIPYSCGISGSIVFSASGTILNIYYDDPKV